MKSTTNNHLTADQKALAKEAKSLDGDIDSCRWTLAALALDAEKRKIPAYAEVIGNAVRRSPSTIYEWRRVMLFHNALPRHVDVSFSFYKSAENACATGAELNAVLDWMIDCELDKTITLDSARVSLPKAKPVKTLESEIEALMSKINKLCERENIDKDTRSYLTDAFEKLRLARSVETEVMNGQQAR